MLRFNGILHSERHRRGSMLVRPFPFLRGRRAVLRAAMPRGEAAAIPSIRWPT